jgi:hypothetical protein
MIDPTALSALVIYGGALALGLGVGFGIGHVEGGASAIRKLHRDAVEPPGGMPPSAHDNETSGSCYRHFMREDDNEPTTPAQRVAYHAHIGQASRRWLHRL